MFISMASHTNKGQAQAASGKQQQQQQQQLTQQTHW